MRRFKNKYITPKKPFDAARIEEEKELKKEYGLKNKKEIWRVDYIIKKIRKTAKELIRATPEKQKEYIEHLAFRGFVSPDATLDEVLAINRRNILERRLQTIVYRLKLANTIKQARQFIVHGHVKIKDRKVNVPGYLVNVEEEKFVSLDENMKKLLKNK
jgi:small subunit ribosomal protein S4